MIIYKKGGWIKKAADSVKKRGTKGKCGPNCDRPGCTGRALALCHAFHTIARRRKNKKQKGGILYDEKRAQGLGYKYVERKDEEQYRPSNQNMASGQGALRTVR